MTRRVRLAIDTATDRLSVACAIDDAPVVEHHLEGARRHASGLLPLIGQALAGVGAAPDDLALIAVADGPGSFTGLRVGVAVAKALALAGRLPLVSAPSLLVRAAAVAAPGERVLAMTSALRGEVYAGVWAFEPSGRITVAMSPRTLAASTAAGVPEVQRIVGEGPAGVIAALRSRLQSGGVFDPGRPPSAAVLLALVDRPGGVRRIEEPAEWEPTYGRPAEAQAKWEREHGRCLPDPQRDAG